MSAMASVAPTASPPAAAGSPDLAAPVPSGPVAQCHGASTVLPSPLRRPLLHLLEDLPPARLAVEGHQVGVALELAGVAPAQVGRAAELVHRLLLLSGASVDAGERVEGGGRGRADLGGDADVEGGQPVLLAVQGLLRQVDRGLRVEAGEDTAGREGVRALPLFRGGPRLEL